MFKQVRLNLYFCEPAHKENRVITARIHPIPSFLPWSICHQPTIQSLTKLNYYGFGCVKSYLLLLCKRIDMAAALSRIHSRLIYRNELKPRPPCPPSYVPLGRGTREEGRRQPTSAIKLAIYLNCELFRIRLRELGYL